MPVSDRLAALKAVTSGAPTRVVAAPEPLSIGLVDNDGEPSPKAVRKAALALGRRGFCVCKCGVDRGVIADAALEAAALYRKKLMTPGGFTVGGAPVLGRDHARGGSGNRDDHILWLHEYLSAVGGPKPGGAETLTALDQVLTRFAEAVVHALASSDKDAPLGRASDGSPLHFTGRCGLSDFACSE